MIDDHIRTAAEQEEWAKASIERNRKIEVGYALMDAHSQVAALAVACQLVSFEDGRQTLLDMLKEAHQRFDKLWREEFLGDNA